MQLPADFYQIHISLHQQVCQILNSDPSTSDDIADDNEQIIIDPSNTRGQVYLHYTGPGSGLGPPRYF